MTNAQLLATASTRKGPLSSFPDYRFTKLTLQDVGSARQVSQEVWPSNDFADTEVGSFAHRGILAIAELILRWTLDNDITMARCVLCDSHYSQRAPSNNSYCKCTRLALRSDPCRRRLRPFPSTLPSTRTRAHTLPTPNKTHSEMANFPANSPG